MKRFPLWALALAVCVLHSNEVFAIAKNSDVVEKQPKTDAAHAKTATERAKIATDRANTKSKAATAQRKIDASVDQQLKDLVKHQRTKNGWLGDSTFPENVRILKDIPYAGTTSGAMQKLDLYIPSISSMEAQDKPDVESSSSNFTAKRKELGKGWPLIVWIHGGGWKSGDKKGGPFRALLHSGFAVASINYRLTNEARWPAQLDDCRTAMTFLRDHAGDYDLDSKRIGVWGASAGGHLALMLAMKPDKQASGERSMAAVCDWFGPTDLKRCANLEETTTAGLQMLHELFALADNDAFIAACNEASPLTYVGQVKTLPPMLIMHGRKDRLVSIKQSQRLVEALKSAGFNDVKFTEINGGHGYPGFGGGTIFDVIKFFKEKLK